MAFESVKQNGPVWQPTQTGSKKESNLVPLVAGPTSFIEGYYLGCETGKGPDNNSTIHKLKGTKVGDAKHVTGEKSPSGEVSIWGTAVLNDNLSNVSIGSMIRIVWEGKKAPKKGGNEYHGWDVLVDTTVEPLKGASVAPSNAPAPAAASPVIDDAPEAEVDDLPF